MGEAASRLPAEVTSLAPDVPWRKIRAMRNLIAHDYAGIDAGIVWKTVQERLPELKVAVTSLRAELPERKE
ncbi:HepT-like ribonuclease domain-containing protein [Reyranella sp.]|uniref:HepT-like ribonuclease domain-containing protein n=1 Tax=Reyranella sp. TaxID=1929291 RepID=UPI003D10917C